MSDIGRWGVVDGKAVEYNSWSPYNYALNRPNVNVDYDGFGVTDPIKNLKVPNNPNDVDPNVWVTNPNHKAPGSIQWVDKNGNKLIRARQAHRVGEEKIIGTLRMPRVTGTTQMAKLPKHMGPTRPIYFPALKHRLP